VNAPYRLLSPTDRVHFWSAFARRGIPGALTLLLTALMTMPLFASFPLMPHFALLGVFVWATLQSELMPPWLAFLIGLAADLLLGLPLGVNATLLPMVAIFVRIFQATYGRHRYGFDWALAALVILAFEAMGWQLLAFAGTHGPFAPLLIQVLTTILAYPAVVWLCARLQRGIAEAL